MIHRNKKYYDFFIYVKEFEEIRLKFEEIFQLFSNYS